MLIYVPDSEMPETGYSEQNRKNKKAAARNYLQQLFYAGGETRTRTSLRITDFESVVSTIPPHRLSTDK